MFIYGTACRLTASSVHLHSLIWDSNYNMHFRNLFCILAVNKIGFALLRELGSS